MLLRIRGLFVGIVCTIHWMKVLQCTPDVGQHLQRWWTHCGRVLGTAINAPRGSCDVYLGIPFAAPPIGVLRFKKPQPAACWKGDLNASITSPTCIQVGNDGTEPHLQSEDCLYLNIFAPKKSDPTALYPIMVSIHGGGFVVGSAQEGDNYGICDNLSSRGVIVVTLQYRLNVYGFLSTGSSAALGNYAIWDIIAALEWVKRNIAGLGGDPDKVTLFGNSAGGAAASLLTYTPISKDLFSRTIIQSGSGFMRSATFDDSSVHSTKRLMRVAKCVSQDDNEALTCLRNLSTVQLQKLYNSIFPTTPFTFEKLWGFRVDGELFTDDELRQNEPGKATVIGVNSEELPASLGIFTDFEHLQDNFFPENNVNTVIKAVSRYVYVDSKGRQDDPLFIRHQSSKFLSDFGFRAPVLQEASSKLAGGTAVWVYKFDYYTKRAFPDDYPFRKGAPHASELCYIYKRKGQPSDVYYPKWCPLEYNGDDATVANFMGEMWTKFAATGDPSPSQIHWPQFQNATNANALRISSKLDIESDFYSDVDIFWNSLVPTIYKAFQNATTSTGAAKSGCCSVLAYFHVYMVIHMCAYL